MLRISSVAFAFCFSLLPSVCAEAGMLDGASTAQTHTLYHRFVSSTADDESGWSPRGSLHLEDGGSSAQYTALDSSRGTEDLEEGDNTSWYQLGIETEQGWVMGSTRACFLSSASASPLVLTVHLDPVSSSPTSLTVHPANVPRSGICPSSPSGRTERKSRTWQAGPGGADDGVRVVVKRPDRVVGPALAAPPVVDSSTGLPAPPPVEKSFLQKYWVVILGLGLFLVSQMGPEEAKREEGGTAVATAR